MKNNFYKKIFALFMSIAIVFSVSACGSDFEGRIDNDIDYSDNSTSGLGDRIGVSMPAKDLQRWVQDGENMQNSLRKSGFIVDLQYADNEVDTQIQQIQAMIDSKCKVLIVASIDGTKLTNVLDKAKSAGIYVIAYDRLIMDTDAVSYYATFDNYMVGVLQGKYIADALNLADTDKKYNIELFTGSPSDNNCKFFFGGAMEILQPYIDEGKLVIPSGQTAREECSITDWSTEVAQERMDELLQKYYKDGKKLDAILSSNDSVACGVSASLSSGYKGDYPILTGQDCDINSVINILNGKQSMSVFKDTRVLADKVVEMTKAIINGEEVPVNDTETYDNGTGVIKSYLCEPVYADKDNYKEILLDSGYYTEDQLK